MRELRSTLILYLVHLSHRERVDVGQGSGEESRTTPPPTTLRRGPVRLEVIGEETKSNDVGSVEVFEIKGTAEKRGRRRKTPGRG